jgi:hypothetical protein
MYEISNGCIYQGRNAGFNIRAFKAAVLAQEMADYARGQRAKIKEK